MHDHICTIWEMKLDCDWGLKCCSKGGLTNTRQCFVSQVLGIFLNSFTEQISES